MLVVNFSNVGAKYMELHEHAERSVEDRREGDQPQTLQLHVQMVFCIRLKNEEAFESGAGRQST